MTERPPDGERQTTRIVDALSFLCEIALLATLVVAGSRSGHGLPMRILLAAALPILAVAIWGVWMAPTSRRRLDDPRRYVAQLAVFGVTAGLCIEADLALWGIALAVVAAVVFGLTRIDSTNA
jgi:hypothetical protein